MSSVYIHKSQKAPYEPDNPSNKYLPNPLFAEPETVPGTRWAWQKAFGGAEHLLVSNRFPICISVSFGEM